MQKEIDTKKVRELAQKYGLSLVVLFGSRATGKTHKRSDTDVAVRGERPIDLSELCALSVELPEAVRSPRVDVVDMRTAPPLLMREIARDGIVLYEKDPTEFARFQMYAFKRYVEARPLFEMRRTFIKKFLERV